MKSLVRKDLYNIWHNMKSMLLILLFLAVVFTFFSTARNYIFIAPVMCSMMVVTTFSFDDSSDWNRYAMIMPVSKKELVAGKFIILLVFVFTGVVFGLIGGTIGAIFTNQMPLTADMIGEQLLTALAALSVTLILGGISIPLVFRFGAERGRMLLLVSYIVPIAVWMGIAYLLSMLGVALTERFITGLLYGSPVIALAFNYLMYKISCAIFTKQEL